MLSLGIRIPLNARRWHRCGRDLACRGLRGGLIKKVKTLTKGWEPLNKSLKQVIGTLKQKAFKKG